MKEENNKKTNAIYVDLPKVIENNKKIKTMEKDKKKSIYE